MNTEEILYWLKVKGKNSTNEKTFLKLLEGIIKENKEPKILSKYEILSQNSDGSTDIKFTYGIKIGKNPITYEFQTHYDGFPEENEIKKDISDNFKYFFKKFKN